MNGTVTRGRSRSCRLPPRYGIIAALNIIAPHAEQLRPAELARFLQQGGIGVDIDQLISWSWDHVPEDVRVAWGRLSVCRGGFTLDAARALIGSDALRLIGELGRWGLVTRSVDDPTTSRWSLFESVRVCAERRISDELRKRAQRDHALYYVGPPDDGLPTGAPPDFAPERWNIEAAVTRMEFEDPPLAARLFHRLLRVFRGPLEDRWSWFERAARCVAATEEARLEVGLRLLWLAQMHTFGVRAEHKAAMLDAAVAAAERAASPDLWPRVWFAKSELLRDSAGFEASAEIEALCVRARDEAGRCGDWFTEAQAERSAAIHAYALGAPTEAVVARLRAILDGPAGRLGCLARHRTLQILSWVLREAQRLDEAIEVAQQACADACHAQGYPSVPMLQTLGSLLISAEREAEAEQVLDEALDLATRSGQIGLLPHVLSCLGWLELLRGNSEQALDLQYRAFAHFERLGRDSLAQIMRRRLALAHFERGEHPRARILADAARSRSSLGEEKAYLDALAGSIAAAVGDLAASDAAFARCDVELLEKGWPGIFRLFDGFRRLTQAERADDAPFAAVRAELEAVIAAAPAMPDARALARALSRAIREVEQRRQPPLRLSADFRFVHPPEGQPFDLSRRAVLRRVLEALVAHQQAQPDSPLSATALFEAGWPDQRATSESSSARVYVAISTLRKLGLHNVLLRSEAGYLLDPRVAIATWSPVSATDSR